MTEAAPPASAPEAHPAAPAAGSSAPATAGGSTVPAPAADGPAAPAQPGGSPTPFWLCVPRTLAFPLQPAPLAQNAVAAAGFAVAAALLLPSALDAPWRGALTLALAWAAAALYLARFWLLVVERTAAGYLDSRHYPDVALALDWRRPAKLCALLAAAPLLVALLVLVRLPSVFIVALILLYAVAAPAATMRISTNDDLPDAARPARMLETASKVGMPYLLLCLLPMLLCLYGAWSADTLARLVPAPGASLSPLRSATMALALALGGNYLFLAACAQIGYAMFQFSAALGVAVVGPGESRVRASTSAAGHERRMREALVARLVASGELHEAAELIREDMRDRPNDLSLHARLHDVLLREGARPRIEEHADRYLELLIAAGNSRQALTLYQETRARFPGFAPREPGNLPKLAAAAIDELKPELATELIRGFDRKYPGHPAVADVYVLGARILLQSGADHEARRLLDYVVAHHAASSAALEARRYLQRFTKA